ncbi:MAG: c-type cytochrome [Nitrospirota bacterium]
MYFIKAVIFMIVVVGSLVWYANYIPQVQSLPPKVEKFDLTQIKKPKDIARIGQKIFFGKGKCSLCHQISNAELSRCPIQKIFGAKYTKEWLYESITKPGNYYYMDYPHVGVEPAKRFGAVMPQINKPPIDLNEQELLAVISFVQTLGGKVTVTVEEFFAAAPDAGNASTETARGDADAGSKVFAKMECSKCHKAGIKGDMNSIKMAIMEPTQKAKEGHEGFDTQLTIREMEDLISYLLSVKGNGTNI